jgi:hypothetical protein
MRLEIKSPKVSEMKVSESKVPEMYERHTDANTKRAGIP